MSALPAPSRARLFDLLKKRASVFSQTFNPTNIRTGNKVLRRPLRGPAVVVYYPPRVSTFADLSRDMGKLNLEIYDELDADRADQMAITKARGKGAPKKKRTAEESKKFSRKKAAAGTAKGGEAFGRPAPRK